VPCVSWHRVNCTDGWLGGVMCLPCSAAEEWCCPCHASQCSNDVYDDAIDFSVETTDNSQLPKQSGSFTARLQQKPGTSGSRTTLEMYVRQCTPTQLAVNVLDYGFTVCGNGFTTTKITVQLL
jgi:hypothetical protein